MLIFLFRAIINTSAIFFMKITLSYSSYFCLKYVTGIFQEPFSLKYFSIFVIKLQIYDKPCLITTISLLLGNVKKKKRCQHFGDMIFEKKQLLILGIVILGKLIIQLIFDLLLQKRHSCFTKENCLIILRLVFCVRYRCFFSIEIVIIKKEMQPSRASVNYKG